MSRKSLLKKAIRSIFLFKQKNFKTFRENPFFSQLRQIQFEVQSDSIIQYSTNLRFIDNYDEVKFWVKKFFEFNISTYFQKNYQHI